MASAKLAPDCSTCPVRERHVEGPDDAASLAQLAAVLRRCSYRDGQTLFVEGHVAELVLFVRAGAVRLTRLSHDGGEMLLDFVGPGGVVGLSAVFGAEHTATATACGSLSCCAAPASTLRALLPSQPGVALALLRMMRDDVERLRGRIVELSASSAEQRVARFLLDTLPAWRTHARTLTQADMARSLGLTPETLCRILADFRRRRWVEGQGHGLSVLEPALLAHLSTSEH